MSREGSPDTAAPTTEIGFSDDGPRIALRRPGAEPGVEKVNWKRLGCIFLGLALFALVYFAPVPADAGLRITLPAPNLPSTVYGIVPPTIGMRTIDRKNDYEVGGTESIDHPIDLRPGGLAEVDPPRLARLGFS